MKNKVAVITGGSSGIGEAITTTLLSHSYAVLANGRSIKSIFKETDCLALNNMSMLMPDTSQILLGETLQKFGKCDVLVVNAGIIESNNIENINIDKMCEMVRLKVEMSYRIIYTFLKYFTTTEKGHIIIMSSVMGTKTRENSGAYAGCNFALEALAESLRMELADTDIKITCIEPGLVETNLHRDWKVKPKELLHISNALSPQDIAYAVLEILEKPDNIRVPKYMILPKGHKI